MTQTRQKQNIFKYFSHFLQFLQFRMYTSSKLIPSAKQILPFLSALHILIYLAGYGRLTLCYDYCSGQNANSRVGPFCSLLSKMLQILNGLIIWKHVSLYLYLKLLLILLSLIGLINDVH